MHKVPRPATVSPQHSPWNFLCHSGDVAGCLAKMGLDPPKFHELLKEPETIFDSHLPHCNIHENVCKLDNAKSKGREHPQLITAHFFLGVTLFWTCMTCYHWTIATYFGLTGSPCKLWLCFRKHVLLTTPRKREDAKVRMPDEDKLTDYVSSISA